jgi:hypothetical protein
MTAQQHPSLATDIESSLRAAPGVRGVYRSGTLVSNLIGRGAAALGVSPAAEALVSVTWEGDRVRVEASIGVEAGVGAPAAVRGAHAVVEALLAAEEVESLGIRLTVVHVQES